MFRIIEKNVAESVLYKAFLHQESYSPGSTASPNQKAKWVPILKRMCY